MSALETADVVVVGSGFGGAIPAYHLAVGGAKVVVLERGPRLGAADLAKEPPATRWLKMVDIVVGDGMTVLAGNCVGGGSMHYFGVSLRAPTFAFQRVGGAGRPLWPRAITRETLDPWYARAERALPVTRLTWSDVSVHGGVFAGACAKAGRTCNPTPLAVDVERCVDCGWMFSGCAYSAKRSMMLNYLPAAEAHGAQVRDLHEVQTIAPARTSGYRYRLEYRKLSALGYLPAGTGAIEAKVVVVAAGTVATPVLLRRSADLLGGVPEAVGRHFSGNGDHFMHFHMNQGRIAATLGLDLPGTDKPFDGFRIGKSITTMAIDRLTAGRKEFDRGSFQDCYLPIVSNLLVGLPIPLVGTALFPRAEKHPAAVPSLLTTLGMAEDDNEGVFGAPPVAGAFTRVLPGLGLSGLRYRANANTRASLAASMREQRAILERDGLGVALPLGELTGPGVTAHPLSSCRVGDDPATSALDDRHELRGHPGIFVTDGSSVPGALCVNPSLTIAALAERATPHIVKRLAATAPVTYRGTLPGRSPAPARH
ncbi:GMC oxidoreductase [Actinomadura fulvescens]|uniref:Cholesterol oxidase n=1 Tax=Actinomadura fulvescens TaxID=46160 RepID=A0ABP6CZA7_9ACTN